MTDRLGTARPGQQPPDELAKRLNDFIAHLRAAADVYEQGDLRSQQKGVAGAAYAAYAFVQSVGVPHRLEKPLSHLTVALTGILYEIPSSLLQPTRSSGRPLTALERKTLRIYAAVAMELLTRAGHRNADAARTVADRLRTYRVRGEGRRELTAKTVEKWRERIPENASVKRRYDRILQEMLRREPEPEGAAHLVLNELLPRLPLTGHP